MCIRDSCDSGGVSKHLGQIADSMYEWAGPVADQLGLSQVDITAIKTAHPMKFNLQVYVHMCFSNLLSIMIHDYGYCVSLRRAALEKWKQHHGSSATYRNLIAAFEQAGHKDFADNVCKIAGK